jgi:uncharacterized membrane protein
MSEFLQGPIASLIFLLALTATLIAVGIYVIGKVRAGMRDEGIKSSEYLTNFQELHARGELNDEEFRTIKAMLSARLQQELKSQERRNIDKLR